MRCNTAGVVRHSCHAAPPEPVRHCKGPHAHTQTQALQPGCSGWYPSHLPAPAGIRKTSLAFAIKAYLPLLAMCERPDNHSSGCPHNLLYQTHDARTHTHQSVQSLRPPAPIKAQLHTTCTPPAQMQRRAPVLQASTNCNTPMAEQSPCTQTIAAHMGHDQQTPSQTPHNTPPRCSQPHQEELDPAACKATILPACDCTATATGVQLQVACCTRNCWCWHWLNRRTPCERLLHCAMATTSRLALW